MFLHHNISAHRPLVSYSFALGAAWLAIALLSSPLRAEVFSKEYAPASGESSLACAASYRLWTPDGVTFLRGVIVHQHGCGTGPAEASAAAVEDVHWRALAKKHECALLAPAYSVAERSCRIWSDPRNGSEAAFLKALDDFAAETNHPELRTAPWCLWGHSGGGGWASIMLARHPNRVVAAWLRSGAALARRNRSGESIPIPEESYQIPIVLNPGVQESASPRFSRTWSDCQTMFSKFREKNAPVCFAPDPQTEHECGDSRYAAIPFFDECLRLRLPEKNTASNELKPLDRTKELLHDPECGTSGVLTPFDAEKCNALNASFLVSDAFALVWEGYVVTGSIPDDSAPPAPYNVKIKNKDGKPTLTWNADADVQSGLMGFIITENDKPVKRMLADVKEDYLRPCLQGVSFHDTPLEPTVAFEWQLPTDPAASPGATFRVINVNTLGAPSEPSEIATIEP